MSDGKRRKYDYSDSDKELSESSVGNEEKSTDENIPLSSDLDIKDSKIFSPSSSKKEIVLTLQKQTKELGISCKDVPFHSIKFLNYVTGFSLSVIKKRAHDVYHIDSNKLHYEIVKCLEEGVSQEIYSSKFFSAPYSSVGKKYSIAPHMHFVKLEKDERVISRQYEQSQSPKGKNSSEEEVLVKFQAEKIGVKDIVFHTLNMLRSEIGFTVPVIKKIISEVYGVDVVKRHDDIIMALKDGIKANIYKKANFATPDRVIDQKYQFTKP